MTAATGRHCARHFEDTHPITSQSIARAMDVEHWRHRREMSDVTFARLLIVVVPLAVGLLAAFVSGWSP